MKLATVAGPGGRVSTQPSIPAGAGPERTKRSPASSEAAGSPVKTELHVHNFHLAPYRARFGAFCVATTQKSPLVAADPIEREILHPCESQSPNSIRNAVEWEEVHS